MAQFITSKEAADLIFDDASIQFSNFSGNSLCDDIIAAVRERFDKEGHPRNLYIHLISGAGDYKPGGRGVNRWNPEGLVGKFYGSHVGNIPDLNPGLASGKIPGHLLPQGPASLLIRQMAAGESGLLTQIGLGTFIDPRFGGGKIGPTTTDEIVELVTVGGKEHLFYKSYPIDFTLLKGSYADEDGNISFELEPFIVEQLEAAAAAHNRGGKVIVQVHKVVQRGSIHPRKVGIPSQLVDYVVVGRPEYTYQTFFFDDIKPELCGDIKIPLAAMKVMPFGIRKIIARRACMELHSNIITNIGAGMAEGVPAVASEEGISDSITFSVESGLIGGVPVEGGMGTAYNPKVVLRQPDNFVLYDGGFLNVTFLGCAEVDQYGNVNVSKFNGRIIGPGGFIDITQNTPKICFLGTFMGGKYEIESGNGSLHLKTDGKFVKFVENVEHITFSGKQCAQKGQDVMFITERAVFKITEEGMTLIEIAPGIDLEKDVLANMEFKPVISKDLKLMDERIFKDQIMGLKDSNK